MASRIYLDNAATTQIDEEVLEAMLPLLRENFGNPSSIHAHGRKIKASVETARKTVANLLHTSPAEIFFTSGGTEADNTAILSSIETYEIKHAITSKIEHHAVLHTLQHLEKAGKIELSYVDLTKNGSIDLESLEKLLIVKPKSLVSLMHANNEIGNITDIQSVGMLCKQFEAIYHSDTVQTMGHFSHNLQELNLDFLVGAAHKFHGPKGVGFLYVNANNKIHPLIHGGSQERNMRGGTENVYGIVGLAKALEIAYREMDAHKSHIEGLKSRMIEKIKEQINGVTFNGNSADLNASLYTVLNVSFPEHPDNEMLLFNLDIEGISCSGGSACSSGTDVGSHVLNELSLNPKRANVRFSFSKYNTVEEIDKTVEILVNNFNKKN